jgi:ferric-dicitrate binding protein FerR (iron transport regulator)
MVPNDAITLELEDGTLKVLEADGTSIMTNNNGNVLLEQKGNQLIYSSDSEVEKLVYNTLTIPHGKTFKLKLSDGTIVHMNAGSSTRYPIKFIKGSNRKIFITGEAYLDVTKDPSHPFIVNSNYLNIRVLGTKFNINSYPEDDVTEIVLVEGSVSLYDESKIYAIKSSALLKPKHKAIFTRKNKDIQIHPVNTNIYTSWRNGELVFRDMTFNNILKKMERHYNITIINNNSNLSKTIFNASFGIVPIEKVLQELREVYGISYTINNRTITIK